MGHIRVSEIPSLQNSVKRKYTKYRRISNRLESGVEEKYLNPTRLGVEIVRFVVLLFKGYVSLPAHRCGRARRICIDTHSLFDRTSRCQKAPVTELACESIISNSKSDPIQYQIINMSSVGNRGSESAMVKPSNE